VTNMISRQIEAIKREVRKEGIGWFVSGGFVLRQLKGFAALVPVILALLFLDSSLFLSTVAIVSFVVWGVWLTFTFATGMIVLCKKLDREHDSNVRPLLSKEYRDR
jgi:hypothetical protein